MRCCQTRAWTGEAVAGLRGAHRDGHHFGKLRDAGLVTSSTVGLDEIDAEAERLEDTDAKAELGGGLASLELVDPLAGDTGDRRLSRRPSTIGLMKAQPRGVVIDASLRFARSNPDLTRHARENAGALDVSVDDLLLDAIARVVASRRADVRHTTPTMMGACGVHVLAAGGAPR